MVHRVSSILASQLLRRLPAENGTNVPTGLRHTPYML